MNSGNVVLTMKPKLVRLVTTMSFLSWLMGCGALLGADFTERTSRDDDPEDGATDGATSDSNNYDDADASPLADGPETSRDAEGGTDEDAEAGTDEGDGRPDDDCSRWLDARTCPSQGSCCNGNCVANDPSNCFGCGMKCSGITPACSASLGHCACTSDSCTTVGKPCNFATGRCEQIFDFDVDAAAPTEGTGTQAAPFRTITKAIQAADAAREAAPTTRASISVAAGRYDHALGEVFPLVLRSGSIHGAGADRTVIAGSGKLNHGDEGGTWNITLQPTIVAGDSTANIEISALTNPSGG